MTERPAAVSGPRASVPSRRRIAAYVGLLAGVTAAGWGVARWWDWRLHQPALEHYRKGLALSQQGNEVAALGEWQAAIESEPWWPEPYFRLAEGFERAGHPETAIQVLRRASEKSPTAPHVSCRLAEIYGRMEDQVGAAEWATVAVKKEPDCPQAHLIYARTHRARLADTLEHYQKAIQLSHDDSLLLELAKVQAQSGDLKAAGRSVDQYLAKNQANGEAHYLQGFILSRRAHDPQSTRKAAAHFQAVFSEDPGRYDAQAELGLLYERQRDWARAREHFETARKLNPYSATILFHLATVLRQTRDPQATRLGDEVRTLRAKEKRWREARRELLEKPDDIPLRLETAELSRDLGAHRIARMLTQTVLEQDPENQRARRLLDSLPTAAAPDAVSPR